MFGDFNLFDYDSVCRGLPYSLALLFVLSSHEFGHYLAARYHGIDVTLPYFIPFPSVPGFINFGTMGAVIRTKSFVPSNRVMFDIGVYGPIAGFIASLLVLVYGFTHLPDIDYLLSIHPNYLSNAYGTGVISIEFGDTLLFAILRALLTDSTQFVPPMSEVYHYPFLCVGWFGLFITAMNMIPVGQLDGGHIFFSMFGSDTHEKIARLALATLVVLGTIGIADIYWDWGLRIGWIGWLIWAAILRYVIKLKHPPVGMFVDLGATRKVLGYLSILILILSFSPSPFIVDVP